MISVAPVRCGVAFKSHNYYCDSLDFPLKLDLMLDCYQSVVVGFFLYATNKVKTSL